MAKSLRGCTAAATVRRVRAAAEATAGRVPHAAPETVRARAPVLFAPRVDVSEGALIELHWDESSTHDLDLPSRSMRVRRPPSPTGRQRLARPASLVIDDITTGPGPEVLEVERWLPVTYRLSVKRLQRGESKTARRPSPSSHLAGPSGTSAHRCGTLWDVRASTARPANLGTARPPELNWPAGHRGAASALACGWLSVPSVPGSPVPPTCRLQSMTSALFSRESLVPARGRPLGRALGCAAAGTNGRGPACALRTARAHRRAQRVRRRAKRAPDHPDGADTAARARIDPGPGAASA